MTTKALCLYWPLSTKIAIQFLEYWLKMRYFSIQFLCVENVIEVMAGFYQEGVVTLNVEYDSGGLDEHQDCHLNMSSTLRNSERELLPPLTDKSRLITKIVYLINQGTTVMPHMGLIDVFGHSLRNVRFDMNEDEQGYMMNDDSTNLPKGYNLDQVFQKCPNLNTLILMGTHLLGCSLDSMKNNRSSLAELAIMYCFVNSDFLTSLSLQCSYIGELKLRSPTFVKPDGMRLDNNTNITIDMPNTRFSKIVFEFDDTTVVKKPLPKFYLKISTENSSTVYFTGDKFSLEKCSAESYEESLENDSKSLSIYIRCIELDGLFINTCDVNMAISTTNNYSFEVFEIEYARNEDDDEEEDDNERKRMMRRRMERARVLNIP